MSARGSEHLEAADVLLFSHRAHDGLGAVLGRRQVDFEPVVPKPLGRRRAHHAQPGAGERAQVVRRSEQALHEDIHGVGARENDPVEGAGARAGIVERRIVVRRKNPNHRRLDRFGAHRLEQFHELARLLAWPRHQNALSEQRPRVEPPQVLSQRRDASHDENRRPPIGRLARQAKELVNRSEMRLLRRQRAVVDDRGGIFGRPAVRKERVENRRQLIRPRVADDGAVELRQAGPVDGGARLALVLVPAHERQRVAAAWIGDGDAGIARHADAGRHAGHDLEAHALFVQKQRFRAASIEDERIAPLQPGDRLAFARLFGQQIADGFLFERLRSRTADVDLLRVRSCVAQQARVNKMIVKHHVRRLEALESADRDEPGITGSGADEIHRRARHG